MNEHYEQIRRQSLGWVRQAGLIARNRFGTAVTSRKPDGSPVTDVDLAVQDALLEAIAHYYPDDAVIAEEAQSAPDRHSAVASATCRRRIPSLWHRRLAGAPTGETPVPQNTGETPVPHKVNASACPFRACWVIDPIDGTRNYARAVPLFCVSVALMENGWPVVGIIYDPMADRMYSASAGGGVWLNEARFIPEGICDSPDVLIGSPSGQRQLLPAAVHWWLDRYKLRNTGSTALHLAHLATGGFDAVLVTEAHLWDIAAGFLLGREVGVVTRCLDGSELFPLILPGDAQRELTFLSAIPRKFHSLWDDLHKPV